MNRIDQSILLICLFLTVCTGFACKKSSLQMSEVSTAPLSQSKTELAKGATDVSDPTCCGLLSVGNQGIDKAWHRFTADGRYRLALKEDLKGPARSFGSDSLNSIFAYCWGQLGYNSTKDHLAAIVVDTGRNDADRFGLVIFSAQKDGDGSYKPYWIYQTRDLSKSVVWTASGDLMVADYMEDGSREVSYVRWDKQHRRYVTSKSRPPPA
jgi:hypothetical protein